MNKRRKKILITDDDVSLVQVISTNLQLAGYEVLTAYDGDEALEKVMTEEPDLILLDIRMPRMSGLKVLQALRNHRETADIPVVILTAVDDLMHMNTTAVLGDSCYVTKPFELEGLLDTVRRVLAGEPFAGT